MSATVIHPTAIVGPQCDLAEGVSIGPFCILEGRITLGRDVRLLANVHISGPVAIGEGTTCYPGVCLGFPGQDFKFKMGDPTGGVRIGNNCILREGVTVHAATRPDVPTTIGDRVMMMVASHAGHDARVGNNVILANSALLAGHSVLEDNVTLSGNSAVHQFNRIGRLCFMTGNVGVSTDVPPFCVVGARNTISSVNLVGMRRSGMPRDHITMVRRAYAEILRTPMPRANLIAALRGFAPGCPPVLEMANFIAAGTRPLARADRNTNVSAEDLA
ncbi:MAG: acyl-ACP--UDP-N-acetylglucosamine O-acyltransferase [Phycisphaeraceae bacterium]|nr:acyl-ACP--UDP-N-acetylglucosamine O-acyltransferase [Phycisphaeraceae bacterium]